MLHTDRARAGSFGEDAVLYDRARPDYPAELVDRLLTGRPRSLLDVGCGTGIAARQFAARGVEVLGLEPDERMAAVARRRGLAVEVAGFESWDARGRRYDLVTSAQAWHWVDPVRGAAKAADVMRQGGRIALFWNLGRPPEVLRRRFDDVYAQLAPGIEEYSVLLGRGEAARAEVAAAGLAQRSEWAAVTVDTFAHHVSYTTGGWLDHLQTHSDHRLLEPSARTALLAAIGREVDNEGGGFVMPYETALVTARRR